MNEWLLEGAYDLHIHSAPDIIPRKLTDLELARRLMAVKMAGCAIKCHSADTVGQAAVINEMFPDFQMVGGLVLNQHCGGLNPYAVEASAKRGGKMLWFPTISAYNSAHFADADIADTISLFDENHVLSASVTDVLEVAAQNDLIVCTGHISALEVIALVEEACRVGVKKILLTHVEHPSIALSVEQQKYCVSLGAVVEHCYLNPYMDWVSWDSLCRQIREIGSNHICLSTDLGQVSSPYPEEGMLEFVNKLLAYGFTEKEVLQMIAANPAKLVNG